MKVIKPTDTEYYVFMKPDDGDHHTACDWIKDCPYCISERRNRYRQKCLPMCCPACRENEKIRYDDAVKFWEKAEVSIE